MNRIWLDVSNRIDPVLAEALGEIDRLAADLGIPFAVVGATARDMVLHHGFGLEVRRATRDIDLALEIAHYRAFETLRDAFRARLATSSTNSLTSSAVSVSKSTPLPSRFSVHMKSRKCSCEEVSHLSSRNARMMACRRHRRALIPVRSIRLSRISAIFSMSRNAPSGS